MKTLTHIRPSSNWLHLDIQELWEYRDLLLLLIRRDFVAKYKQTLLGPAWFVLQPLMMTVIFTIIFGHVAKMPTDGSPPFLFYLCGMLAWGYFANTLTATANTFTGNAHLFGKVYFPRLIVPLSVSISNLFAFGIQLLTFLAFWVYFRFATPSGESLPSLWGGLLALLPLLALSGALALGLGLWCSAATAKYKDLAHAIGMITQLWLYATPVIYPLSQIPERWRWVAQLNPMASVCESYKWLFLGEGTLSAFGVLWMLVFSLLCLLSGMVIFQKVGRTFIDTV